MGHARGSAWPGGTDRRHDGLHAVGDGMYEAITEATGPARQVHVKEAIRYQKEQKTLTREVTDSRGFRYTQTGTIGGDLGGFYTIYFESDPFMVNGKSVRLKHTMRLTAPLALSRVDDGVGGRRRRSAITARHGGGRIMHECVATDEARQHGARIVMLSRTRAASRSVCGAAGRRHRVTAATGSCRTGRSCRAGCTSA